MNAHQRRIARRAPKTKPTIKLRPYQLAVVARIQAMADSGELAIRYPF